ncbi:MAG TPA: hypothetical protein VEW48_26430 [Thermoanaerobaculia bacterium]|nr:hypothetical protein [Thermoanaerobaculia bacterium]
MDNYRKYRKDTPRFRKLKKINGHLVAWMDDGPFTWGYPQTARQAKDQSAIWGRDLDKISDLEDRKRLQNGSDEFMRAHRALVAAGVSQDDDPILR